MLCKYTTIEQYTCESMRKLTFKVENRHVKINVTVFGENEFKPKMLDLSSLMRKALIFNINIQ